MPGYKLLNQDSEDAHQYFLTLDDVIEMPPSSGTRDRGNNNLHFNSKNRPYSEKLSASAKHFAETVLLGEHRAKQCYSDSEMLQHCLLMEALPAFPEKTALILEFGFCTGRSLNFLAALAYDRDVFGFDWGNGLPEPWRDKFPAGTFRYTKRIERRADGIRIVERESAAEAPFIPFYPLANASLVLGKIEDTLPAFTRDYLEYQQRPLAFVFIDTDIYSTCLHVFETLDPYIEKGKTVFVLDEGYNFTGYDTQEHEEWKKHEFRAMEEYADENGLQIRYLAFNQNLQQLAFIFE
ncbi:MAG TPA: hypothetical protein DCE41_32730 [Cytophagales bacterium]|nr:hypothetical protein [Cytophagales bacterium]HAA21896.1 hypothetical protein [Cytophagales bacterium]HAP64194.1 hypothetical protein [Cytophagales bacterium]